MKRCDMCHHRLSLGGFWWNLVRGRAVEYSYLAVDGRYYERRARWICRECRERAAQHQMRRGREEQKQDAAA